MFFKNISFFIYFRQHWYVYLENELRLTLTDWFRLLFWVNLVNRALKTLCGALTISVPPSLLNYWL